MLGLAFLFTCVTQPSSCRAQQLLEVQEKYLISSRHRSPRSNVSRDDGQGEALATEGGASLSILSSLRRERRREANMTIILCLGDRTSVSLRRMVER